MNKIVKFFVMPILMFQMVMPPELARWAAAIFVLAICGGVGIGKVLFGS